MQKKQNVRATFWKYKLNMNSKDMPKRQKDDTSAAKNPAPKHDVNALSERSKASVYWNEYYSSRVVPVLPSQFAVFIAGELGGAGTIIEFGCGSGRDALFFARHGLRTLGIDGSSAAIEFCDSQRAESALSCVDFICKDVSDPGLLDHLNYWLSKTDRIEPLVLYARFFLHAIPEQDEDTVLKVAAELLSKRKGYLAVEFRTVRDSHQTKVTPEHYRRFIEPIGLLNKAHELGLRSAYFVEGVGYAKYRDDDAHVARCIFVSKSKVK